MKLWRTPFDHNHSAEPLAYVFIDRERCKGCSFCVEYCPRDVLKMGPELNSKGYNLAAVKDGMKCLACGFCELICPEFAIRLTINNKAHSEIKPQPAAARTFAGLSCRLNIEFVPGIFFLLDADVR